jgi:hypothetical protein
MVALRKYLFFRVDRLSTLLVTVMLVAGLSLVFSSCASERRLAANFVVRQTNINVLLLPPPGLIKSFSPVPLAELPEGEGPVFELDDSKFLEELNDTSFVNYYLRSLRYHLSLLQINVFGPENLDEFLQSDTTAFIFSLAQVELLEFNDYYTETATIDTVHYRVDLPRTNMELSSWFEFTEVNHVERPVEVLYSMQNTSDYFDGRFFYNVINGEVTYRRTAYPLETQDIYNLAYFAGQKNAGYIFDYLMNLYVSEKSRTERPPKVFYQYDAERHAIRRAYNDRFIVLQTRGQQLDLKE